MVKKGNSHITDLVKSLIGENPLNTIVFICMYRFNTANNCFIDSQLSMMIVTAPIILYCSKSVENKEIQIAESDAVTFNGRINIIFCIYAENGLYRKLLALR